MVLERLFFLFTLHSPSESNLRDVSGFFSKLVLNLVPSSSCKNNPHVLLLSQFEDLIVGNFSWPKDIQDFSETECVKTNI